MSASVEDFDERLRAQEMLGQRNTDALSAHEDLCAERYGNIHKSIDSMRGILLWVGGGLLASMAGILATMIFFPDK